MAFFFLPSSHQKETQNSSSGMSVVVVARQKSVSCICKYPCDSTLYGLKRAMPVFAQYTLIGPDLVVNVYSTYSVPGNMLNLFHALCHLILITL